MSQLRWKGIFALLLLPGASLRAQQVPVALRAEATVQGKTIRLTDLLPDEASSGVRLVAERITLGRAPEPGSIRVFSSAELRGMVGRQMAATFPARAVIRGAGWPLRDASVRRALRDSPPSQGIDFSQARLIPPADFSTRNSDPRLEVMSIGAGNDARKLSARLRCEQREDCGSFLVEIELSQALPVMEGPSRAAAIRAASSVNHSLVAVGQVALVQPGRPAKMLLEGEGFRITTPVLPLQRAAMGQRVRVFDPAARQVSLAQVEGKDLLSFRGAQ